MTHLSSTMKYLLPAALVFALMLSFNLSQEVSLPRLPVADISPVLLEGAAGYKDTPLFTKGEGVSFAENEQGALIPVAADGTPFATCGTLASNRCSLFKEGITINNLERTHITKIEHQINPTCMLYIINYGGVDYVWYDVSDPNCAKYNGVVSL